MIRRTAFRLARGAGWPGRGRRGSAAPRLLPEEVAARLGPQDHCEGVLEVAVQVWVAGADRDCVTARGVDRFAELCNARERLLLGGGAGPLNEPAAVVPTGVPRPRSDRYPAVRSVPLEVVGDERRADAAGAAGADLLHQLGMEAAPEVAAGCRVTKPLAVLAVGGGRDKRGEVAVLGAGLDL